MGGLGEASVGRPMFDRVSDQSVECRAHRGPPKRSVGFVDDDPLGQASRGPLGFDVGG
jgi:hypothetical protein